MDENAQFYTKFNDQKIFLNGSVTQNIPTSGGGPPPAPTIVTVLQDLGKITSARFWFSVAGGPKFIAPNSEPQSNIAVQCYVTSNSIGFSVLNSGVAVDVTFFYRMYYDD